MVAKKSRKHKGKQPVSRKRLDIGARTNGSPVTPGEEIDTGQPKAKKWMGWPKHDEKARQPQPPGVGTT